LGRTIEADLLFGEKSCPAFGDSMGLLKPIQYNIAFFKLKGKKKGG
jgi:hypothetical protein